MDKYLTEGIKIAVEEDLKEIRKCKIHILMLEEKNNELCAENNKEIERLNEVIKNREEQAEDNLKRSGERKIDTLVGFVAYREIPDSWEYDLPKLFRWAKEDENRKEKYIKIIPAIEEFKKAELKKDIANGLIKYDDVVDFGLTIKKQEPKFNYKLNGGVL